MIITDFLLKTGSISFVCAPLCAFFKKANITAEAAAPCITGLLCGAPVSARTVKELYESGRLTSEESDALLCAANPTSPAFIICAVGCGMLGSVRIGVFIWSFSFLISFLNISFNLAFYFCLLLTIITHYGFHDSKNILSVCLLILLLLFLPFLTYFHCRGL